jgi:hypothetical protein
MPQRTHSDRGLSKKPLSVCVRRDWQAFLNVREWCVRLSLLVNKVSAPISRLKESQFTHYVSGWPHCLLPSWQRNKASSGHFQKVLHG